MKAVGTKTAASTSVVATIGPVTSRIAFFVASRAESPSRIHRSTFSTTTIASSTTIPIASTSPNSERLLNEKPSSRITAKVPTSETGTAAIGTSVARHCWRKTSTTTKTSTVASKSVLMTSRIDSSTKTVVS